MRSFFGICIAAFLLVSPGNHLSAQTQDAQVKIKSMYIRQFASLVDWPAEFKTGDFVIGVFGKSPLYEHLVANYANKMVGSQPIKIKNFEAYSDISQCHILIVTPENSDRVSDLVKKYKSKSTLIITEKEGKLKDGAVINFVVQNNKPTYELSKTNANKIKLVIGTKLENLAARVE